MPSEKRERFFRMRDVRLPKAKKAIELLANFSNRSTYDYERSELEEIVRDIEHSLDVVKSAYGIVDTPPAPVVERSSEVYTDRIAVDGKDRNDIKAAVIKIQDGDIRGGVEILRKVILGWTVKDDV